MFFCRRHTQNFLRNLRNLLLVLGLSSGLPTAFAGNPINGNTLYHQYACDGCHGPTPYLYNVSKIQNAANNPADITFAINKPSTGMGGYTGLLTATQLDDIATYIANPNDISAPTVPAGLTATAMSSSQINLSWTASTDNVGVTAYKVYRDGLLFGTMGNVTGASNTGLAASTTHSYTVVACDAANNCSAQSAAATATTVAAGATLNLVVGWNLLGNSVNAPFAVAERFANTANVSTVWKWVPATSKWAFYTPLQADGGAAYALTKGYDFLTTINGGEGFWVNAKTAFTAQLPAGAAINASAFSDQTAPPNHLPAGWSLIAVGDNPSPRTFANTIAISQPVSPAVAATSLTTLWAWDSGTSSWYFYAPSLDNSNGLVNYTATKGYLDFAARSKTLDPTTGFWVNHP